MISIGSNIAALNAERRLSRATSALQQNFQRLSSGLRINKASDDAAGLAIAEQLRTDSRLYTVASRNVNDGLSMLNIAESALEQQSNILNRLQELAEQSANGTLSYAQRTQLHREYVSLATEFGRIGDTTKFNGFNPLLGGRGSNSSTLSIQAGVTSASTSQLSFASPDFGSISGTLSTRDLVDSPTTTSLRDSLFDFQDLGRALDWLDPLGTDTDTLPTLYRTVTTSTGQQRELAIVAADVTYDSNQTDILFAVFERTNTVASWAEVDGLPYSLFSNDSFILSFDATTGKARPGGSLDLGGNTVSDASFSATVLLTGGATAKLNLDFRGLSVFNESVTSKSSSAIELSGVETVDRARTAMSTIRRRMVELNSARGEFGAAGSRLLTALATLDTQRENSSAAESRIRDVDVAEESAALVRSSIIQQAAASVLQQASLQPSIALQLLRG